MPVPADPKIYHIVHVDRLPSIIADGFIWSDAEAGRSGASGTTIGMGAIKQQRLNKPLNVHPGLRVGECAPFYFCPRSVMLYVIRMANHRELTYRGGQGPIVHLQADLRQAVAWADANRRRWAFTLSNAASAYAEERRDLAALGEIDWDAVEAEHWMLRKEEKQAEFLMEHSFPWELVSFIGVHSLEIRDRVQAATEGAGYQPVVAVTPNWYY